MDRFFYFPTSPISCTYFTLENCKDLNIKKIKKISQEDAILIKNLYLSKQYGVRRLLSELSDNGWKAGSICLCWRESARLVQFSGYQAAVDTVRRVAHTHVRLLKSCQTQPNIK